MSTAPGAQGFSFWAVISEARRIIRAHNRHFFALSLVFVFPLCFSSVIYLALYAALSQHDGFYPQQWLLLFPADPTGNRAQPILLPLLFNLFAFFFTLCALGTITYSTFNGFYGRPLTLASSIKSLLYSFLPLLSTQFVYLTIVFCIAMVFGVLAALLLTGLQILGVVEVNYDGLSISFKVLVIMLVLLLVSIILWLQVKWCLAYVIVVEESKWGYEALRRSGQLVKKGMRGVALCVSLYFGIPSLLMNYLMMMMVMVGAPSGHWSWTLVFQAVLYTVLEAQLILHAFAANVVLYIYCKALAEGDFGSKYVCLPFDDADKVSEVV